ncbi:DUF5018 domain-containing protein [Tenacibaculum sp. TC6]|uniref:DUF5018 domain-containing protein n=1 Tax=Tenacibaculum sp. TC6 TaxID=3423223 RepID=UPI003D36E649
MKRNTFLILILSIIFVNCSKDDDLPILSSENKILSFKIDVHDVTYNGVINDVSKEIRIQTLGLEALTSIIPTIEISEKATISPLGSIAQNFNEAVNYIVTAENGQKSNYTVVTSNTPFSSEKKILNFELNIDNESFIGNINHESLTIDVETHKDVSNVSPIIKISEKAVISPNSNDYQDFNEPVEYLVTAQDGTSNVYTVNILKRKISTAIQKCYVRAFLFGRVTYLDLQSQNYQLYIENDLNSYILDVFDIETWDDNGVPTTNFYFHINENVQTAVNYKLRFKVNGQIKAETSYDIDVLKENAPKINSANQQAYNYNDTLILTGENLVAGVRIPANGNVYQFLDNYVSINSDQTMLTLPLTYDYSMFPSWVGQNSPRPTRVSIYYEGRVGDSIVLDFN